MRDPLDANTDWDPPLIHVSLIHLERGRIRHCSRARALPPTVASLPLFLRPSSSSSPATVHGGDGGEDVQLRFWWARLWLLEVMAAFWTSSDDQMPGLPSARTTEALDMCALDEGQRRP